MVHLEFAYVFAFCTSVISIANVGAPEGKTFFFLIFGRSLFGTPSNHLPPKKRDEKKNSGYLILNACNLPGFFTRIPHSVRFIVAFLAIVRPMDPWMGMGVLVSKHWGCFFLPPQIHGIFIGLVWNPYDFQFSPSILGGFQHPYVWFKFSHPIFLVQHPMDSNLCWG